MGWIVYAETSTTTDATCTGTISPTNTGMVGWLTEKDVPVSVACAIQEDPIEEVHHPQPLPRPARCVPVPRARAVSIFKPPGGWGFFIR